MGRRPDQRAHRRAAGIARLPVAARAQGEERRPRLLRLLGKHKWSIGGAVAGGLLSLLIGGGIFGLLAGIALSVGVAFLGPKTFSTHTDEE